MKFCQFFTKTFQVIFNTIFTQLDSFCISCFIILNTEKQHTVWVFFSGKRTTKWCHLIIHLEFLSFLHGRGFSNCDAIMIIIIWILEYCAETFSELVDLWLSEFIDFQGIQVSPSRLSIAFNELFTKGFLSIINSRDVSN